MLRIIRDLFDRLVEIRDRCNSIYARQLVPDDCQACVARQETIIILQDQINALRADKAELNETLMRALKLAPVQQQNVHTMNEQQRQTSNMRNWGRVQSELEKKYKRTGNEQTPDERAAFWAAKNAQTESEIPELIEALAREEKGMVG